MADFPTVLTNAVDGVPGVGTPIVAGHLNHLEVKVGVDNSAVTTSLDYLLKNPASIDPGHKHSELWAPDGSPKGLSITAAGNVVIGDQITNAALLTLYSNDLGAYDRGLIVSGEYWGTWQNPSGLDGITCDEHGTPTTIDGWVYFNYYSSGGVRFNTGGGNSIFDHNVMIGGDTAFGTSANGVLAIKTTTPPSTAPADLVQLWAADINGAAGYAGLHKRTETTNQPEVVPGVIIKTNTGSPANPYEGLMEINTFDNKVRMYADGGWRELGTW
jgi:hypothetical protein